MPDENQQGEDDSLVPLLDHLLWDLPVVGVRHHQLWRTHGEIRVLVVLPYKAPISRLRTQNQAKEVVGRNPDERGRDAEGSIIHQRYPLFPLRADLDPDLQV
jgi:hypothetical protein